MKYMIQIYSIMSVAQKHVWAWKIRELTAGSILYYGVAKTKHYAIEDANVIAKSHGMVIEYTDNKLRN